MASAIIDKPPVSPMVAHKSTSGESDARYNHVIPPLDTSEHPRSIPVDYFFGYSCHTSHDPLPMSDKMVRYCANLVSTIGQLPLPQTPPICAPIRKHIPQERRSPWHSLGGNLFCPEDAVAGYFHRSDKIVFNVDLWPTQRHALDRREFEKTLVHELVHAGQNHNFPFLRLWRIQWDEDLVDLKNKTTLTSHTKRDTEKRIQEIETLKDSISLIKEGQARWVERASEPFLSVPPTLGWASRLERVLLSIIKWARVPFCGDQYDQGLVLVTAVKALQKELETTPFRDAEGNLFELRADLRGDGVLHQLFHHPEWIDKLMPNRRAKFSFWRHHVNIDFLRQRIIRLPGHTPARYLSMI